MSTLAQWLKRKPVIAAIREVRQAKLAVESGVKILFLQAGDIFDLKHLVQTDFAQRPLLFAHIDLLQGIGRDAAGMQFLAKELGVDGVLTTRSHLVKAARSAGLYALQRLFIVDSEALKTGVKVVRSSKPDAVEILPALTLPYVSHHLPVADLPPIIAGGLVETEAALECILDDKAVAVSTSQSKLWSYEKRRIPA